MIAADTIKLVLPTNNFVGINLTKRNPEIRQKSDKYGEMVMDIEILENIDYGFNYLKFDNIKEEVTLKMSAKILGDDYSQGISLNNIEKVTKKLNGSGAFEITSDEFLKGTTCRIDPCCNIEIANMKKSTVSIINCARLNGKYSTKPYLSKKELGFSCIKNVKKNKEYLTGYSKLLDPNSRKFFAYYPIAPKSFSQNSMRVESNIHSHFKMRELFNTKGVTLKELLQSEENINLKLFQKIMEKAKWLNKRGLLIQKSTFIEDRNMLGGLAFLEQYGYDLVKAKQAIKSTYPKVQHQRAYKFIDDCYAIFKAQTINMDIENIKEIESKLFLAA